MKSFKIHSSFFFSDLSSKETIEYWLPDSLDEVRLMSYLNHHRFKKQDVSPQQLHALLQLLTEAEGFGHDINRMLLRAIADHRSQVVDEIHLKPKVSSTKFPVFFGETVMRILFCVLALWFATQVGATTSSTVVVKDQPVKVAGYLWGD